MDLVKSIMEFNRIAGTENKFNVRKVALYTGLQLEEMAEKLEALNIPSIFDLIDKLAREANAFKSGEYDDSLTRINKVEALDADIDLAIVALGGAYSLGSDVPNACKEVMRSNMSKFPLNDNGEHVVLKDDNGKVIKPDTYSPPDLREFV